MNNINNNQNHQNIGNVNNNPNCEVDNIRTGGLNNLFRREDNAVNETFHFFLSGRETMEKLKSWECPRRSFDEFMTSMVGDNTQSARDKAKERMRFIMNQCAISQADLINLNKFSSENDNDTQAKRIVTWIGERGIIASEDGPAKNPIGQNGKIYNSGLLPNSFNLCVGARQLDKEEIDIDVYFDAEGPGGENKGKIDTEALDEAVKHFDNLGFVIDKDEIAKEAQAFANEGKGPIKIRPLMFNTFGVMSDATLQQASRSGLNAMFPEDVSGTITEGAKVLQKYLEAEQAKASEDGVILIPYITGHSFGGFNATGIAAMNKWRSTMFHPLGIAEGSANARLEGNNGKLYKKLEELNKDPNKHLIFSTINDFTSSDVAPHVGGAIQKGGIFFGGVINVPNKVGTDSTKTLLATHCNYRENLRKNLVSGSSNGQNGYLGLTEVDFKEEEINIKDPETGKNYLIKDIMEAKDGMFGKIKSYDESEIKNLKEVYGKRFSAYAKDCLYFVGTNTLKMLALSYAMPLTTFSKLLGFCSMPIVMGLENAFFEGEGVMRSIINTKNIAFDAAKDVMNSASETFSVSGKYFKKVKDSEGILSKTRNALIGAGSFIGGVANTGFTAAEGVLSTTIGAAGAIGSLGKNITKAGMGVAKAAIEGAKAAIGGTETVIEGTEDTEIRMMGKKRSHGDAQGNPQVNHRNNRGNQNDVQEDDYNSTADSSISLKEDEDI